MDKRTVKVGIELLHTVLIGAFHLYLPEDRIPFSLGCIFYSFEIPSRILRLKIESGILHGNIRYSYFVTDCPAFRKVKGEIHPRILSFGKRASISQVLALPCADLHGISVEFSHKIHLIRSRITAERTSCSIPLATARTGYRHCRLLYWCRSKPCTYYYSPCLIPFRENILCHPCPFGHGEHGLDVILHHSLIISGMT